MKRLVFIAFFIAVQFVASIAQTKLPDTYSFNRGLEAYQAGEYQDALDWFNKEVNEHPDDGYALVYITAIRYMEGANGRALNAINQALKTLPKKDKEYRAVAYATRATIYMAMADTINALNDYADAIKLDPTNIDYYKERAQIYYEQNRLDLADADYNQMISIKPGEVMGYMGLGRNSIAREDLDAAIEKFNYVIKLEPDYSLSYSYRAQCHIARDQYAEAMDDLIRALSIDGDQKAHMLLLVLIDTADAMPVVKTKLQVQSTLEPNDVSWPCYIGYLLENYEKYDEAIPYFEQAQNINASTLFLRHLAMCYQNLGDYTSALSYINQAINMDSTDNDLIWLKSTIYDDMGDYNAAIAELDQYVAKTPDSFVSYYERGYVKTEAKDFDGAIEDFTTAINLTSSPNKPTYFWRGRTYLSQGKTDLANADFNKVIELDSISDDTYYSMFAYGLLGQREKAIELMENSIKADTTNVSYYNAACLFSLLQEPDSAMQYLGKAIELGYRDFKHISRDPDLDNIRNLPEFKALIDQYSAQQPTSDRQKKSPADESTQDAALVEETVEVPFTKDSGVTKVKCAINDLPLHFVFDTGAAEVTMSMVEANFMIKNDYITADDIIGSARYVDANGDVSEGTVINLRKVDFGGLELNNVRASVVRNQKAPLLLGQSVLGRLGKIEIDNTSQTLKITSYKKQ
jgi:tetratricopeptide (TPR) repeat protein